jgi:hypothetical protein
VWLVDPPVGKCPVLVNQYFKATKNVRILKHIMAQKQQKIALPLPYNF